MNENLRVTTEAETSPAHIEGPGTLNLEHHPVIMGIEEKENLVTNLYQQPCEKDKLVSTLNEEVKLLKAKLKGFEALAYLYQQSKNECMSLKKLCIELSEYQKKCSLSGNEIHNTHVSPHVVEQNIFEAADPEEKELNSDVVGDQTENLHNPNVASVVQNEAFLLSGDEYCEKQEEPVEFKSGEFKQAVTVGSRTADDENQSSFSFLEIQSSLASSGNDFGNKNPEKTHDLEISTDVSGNNHELFGSSELSAFHRHLMNPKASKESKNFLRELLSVGMKLIGLEEQMQTEEILDRGTLSSESQNLRQMESSSTQTLDQADTTGSTHGQSIDHGTTPKVDQLTGSSSSPEQRKSSIVTENLITEVQILRQQVMTFKDDFERERRDREKVRSQYDLLKWHFDRVSADFRHLKDQLRSTEIRLEESEREKAALRHNITKTANELRKIKKGSSSTSPRTELVPQRVPTLDVRKTWPCVHCTYLNPYPRQTCEMCGQAAVHRYPLQVQ